MLLSKSNITLPVMPLRPYINLLRSPVASCLRLNHSCADTRSLWLCDIALVATGIIVSKCSGHESFPLPQDSHDNKCSLLNADSLSLVINHDTFVWRTQSTNIPNAYDCKRVVLFCCFAIWLAQTELPHQEQARELLGLWYGR